MDAPTWVLSRGEIVTCDPGRPSAEALAVAGRRIVAVGAVDEIESLAGPETHVTDLAGATVTPGLCDTHMHLEKVSRDVAMLHPAGSRSVADVVERLHVAVAETPPGAWIRTFADTEQWHEDLLAEARLPTQQELDAVSPMHPVFLYRRNDAAVLNRVAADRLARWLGERPAGDWDASSGRLGGLSVRALNDHLYHLDLPSRERELELVGSFSERLLAMGVTSVVDPGLAARFASSWELYREAHAAGILAQRVHLMNRLDYRRPLEEELERVCAGPVFPLEGDSRLRAWAIKILLDGEFANAWFADGQRADGEPAIRYTEEELHRIVTLCAERRWPLCVHVMGGGAVKAVLSAVRNVVGGGLPILPGQVSLAHAFGPDPGDLVECANYGVAISVQPLLAYVFANEFRAAWGPLAEQAIPVASMVRAGLVVAGGSDTLPCEPLHGAHLAVTRELWNGTRLASDEAVSPEQALALSTRSAAHYVGWPHVGVLREGALADLAVWPQNPLRIPTERWAALRTLAVAIDGAPVRPAAATPLTFSLALTERME